MAFGTSFFEKDIFNSLSVHIQVWRAGGTPPRTRGVQALSDGESSALQACAGISFQA
jgi:hypothetical protein